MGPIRKFIAGLFCYYCGAFFPGKRVSPGVFVCSDSCENLTAGLEEMWRWSLDSMGDAPGYPNRKND